MSNDDKPVTEDMFTIKLSYTALDNLNEYFKRNYEYEYKDNIRDAYFNNDVINNIKKMLSDALKAHKEQKLNDQRAIYLNKLTNLFSDKNVVSTIFSDKNVVSAIVDNRVELLAILNSLVLLDKDSQE
jgi:hypothetical protein